MNKNYLTNWLSCLRLSIANATFQPSAKQIETGDLNSTLLLNMDFQDVSTHIHPDIANIIGIHQYHFDFFNGMLSSNVFSQLFRNEFDGPETNEEIPLLLPLTFSIEYEQIKMTNEPLSRCAAVSVDPLSVLLSDEDVKLLQAIAHAWTTKTVESGPRKPRLFDVVSLPSG